MIGDRLRQWLAEHARRFGRPPGPLVPAPDTLDALDRRLDALEHDQREISARLSLLEYQSDLRGWRRER